NRYRKGLQSLLIKYHVCQSQETDLSQTVKAMLGDDVVLPCQVKPPEDPTQTTVEWGRPDLKPRFVFVLHNQKEYIADQNKVYRGRTSLFHDKLKNGNVSLKLSNVRHSDNGKYRCYNPKEKTESFVDLLVGLDKSSSGVMLDCSSASWYPEPEILWLDGEENIMSAGSAEKIKGPDGLYSVSSRKDINQTRETSIYVQGGTFNILLIKEKQQLMKEEEEYLAKKKINFEEELKKRNQDQKIIDDQIEALMKMSEELKEQKEQLTDQKQEVVKIIEENDKKLKAVDDEVTNQSENKMEKRAQGYLKLKEIITESNERLTKRRQGHQHVELMTEKLIEKTSQDVKKLQEIKQEIQNHIVEIEKQLKEM
uniref:Ig-like domain-containing protein n=1 Tax=Cyprinodon variegatus TaxID=28743 RepID=A0A3Q2EDW0_CYPVA